MQEVVYGNSIGFTQNFYDALNILVDPPEVTFSIVQNATNILYGPFVYSNAQIVRVSSGIYSKEVFVNDYVVPGTYAAKWEATIDGEPVVYYENFQIVDPPIELNEIHDPPRLYGIIRPSYNYQIMGMGLTDRLLLIGHANGVNINEPLQVVNMQETINKLGGDAGCPLLRGLLEAYNTGARDIWIMAAAPMSEYIEYDPFGDNTRLLPRAEWGDLNFYQRYAQRLETTYEILLQYDFPEIVVPLEAVFYDAGDVDFFTPLVYNCFERYRISGAASIGILGTRIGVSASSTEVFESLYNDPRINDDKGNFSIQPMISLIGANFGQDVLQTVIDGAFSKFGMVVIGHGIFQLPQMPVSHTSSLAAVVAAELSQSSIVRGLTYQPLRLVYSLMGNEFTTEQVKLLARKRLNTAIRNAKGRRGNGYNIVLATDNTMSRDYSDYWSVAQLRLVIKVSQEIRALGNRALGTIGYASLKKDINDYLNSLVLGGLIRGYELNIARGDDIDNTVFVSLMLQPYIGIREIFFTVEVGPGV